MTTARIPFKNAVISSDRIPAANAAGGHAGDAVADGGLHGVNLWGTGAGQGVPAGYAMIGLDGVYIFSVVIATTAVKENDPIYITSANVLTNVSASNTLFGYADEPGAITASPGIKIGVRIANGVAA